MGIHRLEKSQIVPIDLETAWQFFSDPKNLSVITPQYMGFNIVNVPSGEMYEGMLIMYQVRPLLNVPLTWLTEISHLEKYKYFVDEQRSGPYVFWYHEHHFKELPDKKSVEIRDIVTYKLPLGIIGDLVNKWIVSKQLEEIFDFRKKKLVELFK